MAVLYDNATAGGTTVSFANAGSLLLVRTDNGATGVTYNSISMTKIGGSNNFVWALVTPSIGTFNIVNTGGSSIAAISFTGSNGYGAFGETINSPTGSAGGSLTTTKAKSKIAVFVQASGANSPQTSQTGTVRYSNWNTMLIDEINAPTVTSYSEIVQWNTANSAGSNVWMVEVKEAPASGFLSFM